LYLGPFTTSKYQSAASRTLLQLEEEQLRSLCSDSAQDIFAQMVGFLDLLV